MQTLEILSFEPQHQGQVKDLIEDNLRRLWGGLDRTKNLDIQDIAAHYNPRWFLVALHEKQVVGCGAMIPSSKDEEVQIVRMHTRHQAQGTGIGSKILSELEQIAKHQGYKIAILETTSTWTDAIHFYNSRGYQITHKDAEDTWFIKRL